MLLSGEPRGPGGDVLPIMASFFSQKWPNHAHEYNQSDSGLALLFGKQHTLVRKNTYKEVLRAVFNDKRSFTTENLPTMKTNKQEQQNNGRLQNIRILMYKVKN